jgi:serine/threonine protein kinase
MPRRELEEFELREVIGAGTVGTVHRAIDKSTGAEVAVKILLPAISRDPNITARFAREMSILEKLNHPNVVAYCGGGVTDARLFYAMELVEGPTLEEILRRRRKLSWQETVECAWQVCSALQHADNHGIVHRDVKPSNLFLSPGGELKLGDFGIALDTGESELTEVGLTVGSYQYMAPEQIRGERQISGQTDLYALGCMMYRMITGHAPFQGTNFAQIFDQHLNVVAPPIRSEVPDCPEEVDEVVRQLLAKNPKERPINARTVQGRIAQAYIDWQEQERGRVDWNPAAIRKLASDGPGVAVPLGSPEDAFLAPEEAPANVSWGKLAGLAAACVAAVALARWIGG